MEERLEQLVQAWRMAPDGESVLRVFHSPRSASQEHHGPFPLSDRKWRLAAVACCRSLLPLLGERRPALRAIEVADAAADGTADDLDLYKAGRALRAHRDAEGYCWSDDSYIVGLVCGPRDYADFAAFAVTESDPEVAAFETCYWASRCFRKDRELAPQQGILLRLLRDITGNPTSTVSLDPGWLAWRDGIVVQLAHAVYESASHPEGRLDRNRLAVLADALEDAGCADAMLLAHLRGPGIHTRGCWLVDLLLGKE